MLTVFVIGFACGAMLFAFPLVVWLDRRDEARRRVQLRVDQIPVPLPGAYEPEARRSLVSARRGMVVDAEPDPDE